MTFESGLKCATVITHTNKSAAMKFFGAWCFFVSWFFVGVFHGSSNFVCGLFF